MKRCLRMALAAALVAALGAGVCALAGCSSKGAPQGGEAADNTVQIADMAGRTVAVPADPERIIGLGSSSLRVICYLQAQDSVVGVEAGEQTDNALCTYRHVNHELFSSLPVVGEGGSKGVTPNEEAIIACAPEVIFANIDKDAADSLQAKTGIPVVCLTVSNTIFDQVFYDNVTLMGEVLGRQERASEIVSYMKDTEADLRARTEGVAPKSAYAAGVSFRGGHGFAGTEALFPPFQSTNVVNIADVDGAVGCFDVDVEKVTAAQPDFIFVESGNLGLVKEDVSANPEYFANLTAVQNGTVFSLVSYRFYAANVDLALANCYQVGCAVYPDRFSDVDPTEKLDEITQFFLGASLSSDLAAQGCAFRTYDLLAL